MSFWTFGHLHHLLRYIPYLREELEKNENTVCVIICVGLMLESFLFCRLGSIWAKWKVDTMSWNRCPGVDGLEESWKN